MKIKERVRITKSPYDIESHTFKYQKTPQMIRDEFPNLKLSDLEMQMLAHLVGRLWSYTGWDLETSSFPNCITEQIARIDLKYQRKALRLEHLEKRYGDHYKFPEHGFDFQNQRSKLDLIIKVLGIEDEMREHVDTEYYKYKEDE